MTFKEIENIIQSKESFYTEIEIYYSEISKNRIPDSILKDIIAQVTDVIYSDYIRFWNKYPKSRKRYSKLKFEDLEHPFVHYLITDFLSKLELSEYRNFSKIILGLDDIGFDQYEKIKYQYETK